MDTSEKKEMRMMTKLGELAAAELFHFPPADWPIGVSSIVWILPGRMLVFGRLYSAAAAAGSAYDDPYRSSSRFVTRWIHFQKIAPLRPFRSKKNNRK